MGVKLFMVLALVAGIQAGPISVSVDTCARQCAVSTKFNYEAGTTYEFGYETELQTSVHGASEDHAGLHMTATAHMTFISECEVAMKLTDVTLKEHDPESADMKVAPELFRHAMEANPLRFSYQDGTVDGLCLAENEPTWVANIKRGIVSVFQISMETVEEGQTVAETDVSGNCEATYTSADKGWYNRLIKKTKNLLGCTERQGQRSAIQGTPYTSTSAFQSLPLVKSTHDCEHEIVKSTGRLQTATCKEQHVFAPFSRDSSGAVTTNTQTLTFRKQTNMRSKQVPFVRRSTLKFEHAYDADKSVSNRKDLERKLMEICQTTKSGVRPETPSRFTSLVHTMKTMGASEMTTVYQKIKSGSICSDNNDRVSKFFLDAIPMTGTSESMKLMTQLIVKKVVTGIEADMWLTTLPFIQSPTLDMLAEVRPLLSIDTNEAKAMLSVSSLVHSYCKKHGDCENTMEVRKIINLLQKKIGTICRVTEANMHTALIAIRAIGNAGYGTSAIPVLSKCIGNDNNPIEVRLSAVEAFRRIPCNSDKRTIMNLFTNTAEDSELRIAAYRALMECPSDIVLSKIKYTLEREEVNQVESYVWSHLTNLMETSDPHKQGIRAILEDATLQNEFDMDKRKSSRNYEGSVFIEKLNTGATLESDLIWLSKSFIPRSAMVNLTVDLFGSAVNLFEIGGRVEGLEHFLESYFGPNGYFSENDVQAAADETALKGIKQDKAKRITKRMETVMDELKGSLYMRVFGNELRYMNFHGIDALRPTEESFNFLDLLLKLFKDNDYSFTQSTTFLDSSIIIPTSSGFPMNLTVDGTATIDIKASGKMDVMKVSASPPSIDIHGIIRSSGAVEISSTMSVDAFVTKAGIKMVSTLHSSTAVQGKVELSEGKVLNVQFDLPDEKMDIISVKSAFFTVHRNLEREQKMITENRKAKSICTGEKLARITGIELCGELQFPNASLTANAPYFPITGPVSMGIFLVKRDSLTGYKLEARSTHTGEENIVRLAFSAPGSRVNRNLGFEFNLNKAQGSFDFSFTSPWSNTDFKGTVTNTRAAKGLTGKLNWDNTIRYDVNALVEAEKSGPGMLYKPTLQIRVPGGRNVNMGGSLKYAAMKLFDLDLSLEGIKNTPMSIKAALINKPTIIRASAAFALSKNNEYSFESNMRTTLLNEKAMFSPHVSVRTPTQELFALGGSVRHIFGKKLLIYAVLDKIVSRPITLKGLFTKRQDRRGRSMYYLKVDMRSSPMDVKLVTKLDNRNWKALSTNMDLTYVIRHIARNNVKLAAKINNLSTKTLTKAKCTVDMNVKRNPELNFKLLSNLDHNKEHSEIDANLQYGASYKDPERQVSAALSLDREIKSWSSMSVAFLGLLRKKGNDLRIGAKVAHKHDSHDLSSSISLKYNKNAIDSNLRLSDKSTELTSMSGEYTLSYPGKKISIVNVISEPEQNKYTSSMTAQIGKSNNTIVTKWTLPSANAMSLTSSISISAMKPIVLECDYNFRPHMYSVSGLVQNGPSKYSAQKGAGFRPVKVLVSHYWRNSQFQNWAELSYGKQKIQLKADVRVVNDLIGKITFTSPFPGMESIGVAASHTRAIDNFRCHGEMIIGKHRTEGDVSLDLTNGIDGTLTAKSPLIRDTVISVRHVSSPSSVSTYCNIVHGGVEKFNINADISMDMSLRTLTAIDGRFTVTSPLFKTVQTTMSYYGKPTHFQLALRCTYGVENIVNIQTEMNVVGPLRGHISILSPVTRDIQASFNHDGQGTAFSSKAKLIYGGKLSEGTITFTMNNDIDMSMSLIIPFMKDIAVSFGHIGPITNCKMTVDVSYGGASQCNVIFNINTVSSIDSTIRLTTNLPGFRKMDANIRHAGQLSNFRSHGDISVEGTNIAGDVSFSPREGMLKLKSPFSNDIDGSFYINGDYPAIQSHAELSYGAAKLLELQENMQSPVNCDITIQTSILGFENTHLAVKHAGTRRQFDSHAEITINGATSAADMSVNTVDMLKGGIILTSPMTSPVTANVVYHNTALNTRSKATFTYGDDHHTATFDRNRNDRYGGDLTVTSPLMKELDISIDSNVNVYQLESSAVIRYGGSSLFQLGVSTDTVNTLSGSVSVAVSSNTANMAIDVDGTPTNFKGHTTLTINGEATELDTALNVAANDISARLSVQSPFTRNHVLKFNVNGKPTNLQSHIEANCDSEKSQIDILFNTEGGLDSSVSLVTPIIKPVSAAISCIGETRNFVAKASVNVANVRHAVDASLNTIDAKEGHLTVNSPALIPLSAGFKHTGKKANFRSHADLNIGKLKHEMDVSLDSRDSTLVSITINSPVLPTLSTSIDYKGDGMNFQSHAEVNIDNVKHTVDASLNTIDAKEGNLTVNSPALIPLSAGFKHTGKKANFCSHADLNIGNYKHEMDVSLDSRDSTSGSITINSPVLPTLSTSIDYKGDGMNFQSHAEVNIDNVKHAVDASLNTIDAKEGNLTVNSPALIPLSAGFKHTGKKANFRSHADLNIGNYKHEMDVSLDSRDSTSGSITINSPVLPTMSTSIDYKGDGMNFQSHAEVNIDNVKHTVDASLNTIDAKEGNVTVNSPALIPLSAGFKHTGKKANFCSHADLNIGNYKHEMDVSLDSRDSTSGSITINSPVLPTLSTSIDYKGDGMNFQSHAEVNIDNVKHAVDASLNTIDAKEGNLTVKSSALIPLSAGFKHTGKKANFRSHADLNIGNYKHEMDVSLDSRDSTSGSITINSPVLPTLSTSIDYKGDGMNFQSHAEVNIDNVKHAVDASLNTIDAKEGNLTVNSPALIPLSAGFKHTGKKANFRSHADLNIGNYKHEMDVSLDSRDSTSGSITINSPVLPTLSTSINYKGDGMNFQSHAEVNIDNVKHEIDASLDLINDITGSIAINSPLTTNTSSRISYTSQHASPCGADVGCIQATVDQGPIWDP